jgi:hypothetical protein
MGVVDSGQWLVGSERQDRGQLGKTALLTARASPAFLVSIASKELKFFRKSFVCNTYGAVSISVASKRLSEVTELWFENPPLPLSFKRCDSKRIRGWGSANDVRGKGLDETEEANLTQRRKER